MRKLFLFIPLLLTACNEPCVECANEFNQIEICPTRNGLGIATGIDHAGNVFVWDVAVQPYTQHLRQNGYKCN